MFSLICVWINGWVNNREAGDLRRYLAHYDVTVMPSYQHIAVTVSEGLNQHIDVIRMSAVLQPKRIFIFLHFLFKILHTFIPMMQSIVSSKFNKNTKEKKVSTVLDLDPSTVEKPSSWPSFTQFNEHRCVSRTSETLNGNLFACPAVIRLREQTALLDWNRSLVFLLITPVYHYPQWK